MSVWMASQVFAHFQTAPKRVSQISNSSLVSCSLPGSRRTGHQDRSDTARLLCKMIRMFTFPRTLLRSGKLLWISRSKPLPLMTMLVSGAGIRCATTSKHCEQGAVAWTFWSVSYREGGKTRDKRAAGIFSDLKKSTARPGRDAATSSLNWSRLAVCACVCCVCVCVCVCVWFLRAKTAPWWLVNWLSEITHHWALSSCSLVWMDSILECPPIRHVVRRSSVQVIRMVGHNKAIT